MDDFNRKKIELGIEFCCELAITLYELGAEHMGLPHNFAFGMLLWAIATLLVIRMFWIFPWGVPRLSVLEKALFSVIAIVIFGVVTHGPISEAYTKSRKADTPTLPESSKEIPPKPNQEQKPIDEPKAPPRPAAKKPSVTAPLVAPQGNMDCKDSNCIRDNYGTANQTIVKTPPTRLTCRWVMLSPLSATNDTESAEVHISADQPMARPTFGLVFDGPIEVTPIGSPGQPWIRGVSAQSMQLGVVVNADGSPVPYSAAVSIEVPSEFVPGDELVIPLKSKTAVKLKSCLPIGPATN